MSNSSILSIDKILSGATTLGQGGPGSNGNEGVLCIPQSSSITGASPSNCLVSYPEDSLEMQSMYSTAPAYWATFGFVNNRSFQSSSFTAGIM